MSRFVIRAEGVSKEYRLGPTKKKYETLRDTLMKAVAGLWRNNTQPAAAESFLALNDVSFEIQQGEVIGVIGRNGAGKSTLLKVLSRITEPSAGYAEITGRVGSLLEVGTGFHPELSGRENIYLNGAILGMRKVEISRKFDEIVAFAEVERFIDSPVKHYSSGMYLKLAFAVAAHLEPEILLIDEVLAVGDIKFKAKCYRQLHQLRQQGTSFVLVNHNSQAILNVCDSAIYLVKGELIASDDPKTVIEKYEEDLFMDSQKKNSEVMYLPEKSASESFGLDLIHLFFRDAEGKILESLKSGEPTSFCVGCRAHKKFDNVTLHLKITELGGEGGTGTVLFLSGENDEKSFEVLPGKHEIQLQMPYLGLAPGTYTMSIKLKQSSIYTFDVFESFRFTVRSDGRMSQCKFYQPRSWQLKQTDIKDDSKGAF